MGYSRVKKRQLQRELIDDLSSHKSVSKVTHNHYFIKVTFNTGITEYWALTDEALKKRRKQTLRLPTNPKPFFKNPINTYSQFETNPLDPYHDLLKNHFIIKRKDIRAAGWCDARCKIHDVTLDLYNQGWVDLKYPESMLRQDYLDLQNQDLGKHTNSLIRYSAFHGHAIGRRLILNFIPTLTKDNWNLNSIYRSLSKLIYGQYDITREGLVYGMSLKHHIVRFPGFYRAIFNQWYPIKDLKILDLYPDWGFKALSILVDGGHYYYAGPHSEPLDRLAKFVDGKVFSHKEGNHYDLAMISDVHPIPLDEIAKRIDKYSSVANNLMVVVSRKDCQKAIDLYKPWRILRTKSTQGTTANEDSHILIIGQR